MRRPTALVAAFVLVTAAAGAANSEGATLVKDEAFANAHVTLMARAQSGAKARLADVEVWAEGNKLRARVAAAPGAPADEFWIDGLSSPALLLQGGKLVEPKKRSLEQGLQLSLRGAPELGNSKNDRIAGRPCKVLTEDLPGDITLTRCIWRGLPLSIELKGHGFSFNAGATSVEEGTVAVADLQPPAGAPSAPRSLSATR